MINVGVAIPGPGLMGTVGTALLVNLSAGGIMNDWAGETLLATSVNGNPAARSFNRDVGVAVDAGVAIPGLGIIGTNGAALVVNLSAGLISGDGTGIPVAAFS